MEAEKRNDSKATESRDSPARLEAILAGGCCALPIALMFLIGILNTWVASFGISDKAWSWITLGVLAAAALATVLLRRWIVRRRAEP